MGILRGLQAFGRAPERVVSLVPSVTESLFDLGLGGCLVGVSDQCVCPRPETERITRVGGAKTADPQQILATRPDLILANQEENARECIEALAASCAVWLAFPCSVREVMDDLWEIVYLFHDEMALQRMRSLQDLVDLAEGSLGDRPGQRVFAPVWWEAGQDMPEWWMTFNNQTYCGDLLRLLGGENVFAGRERRYPLAADLGLAESEAAGERDTRYPRVRVEEIRAADPEVILLPDEPFDFNTIGDEQVNAWFEGTRAAHTGKIFRVDGSLLTWHGTRIAQALETLGPLFFV